MTTKILNVKLSKRPIWETKISSDGPIFIDIKPDEYNISLLSSYDLRIDIFTTGMIPDKTVIVGYNHYKSVFQKYSMEDLKAGVKIDSLFDVMAPMELDGEVVLEEEVDILAQKIIDELPFLVRGIDYKTFPSTDLKIFLEQQILSLRNKFKIQPK